MTNIVINQSGIIQRTRPKYRIFFKMGRKHMHVNFVPIVGSGANLTPAPIHTLCWFASTEIILKNYK